MEIVGIVLGIMFIASMIIIPICYLLEEWKADE